jgi:heterodisulfide reductase subunit B2
MKILYYPGCSQKASSISYEKSFLAIAKKLGVEIVELDDWNCCGTTVTISVNEILSLTLSARNLALAEKHNLPVVAPCPSCYISLNKVNKVFKENPKLAAKVNEALSEGGLHYNGKAEVYNILDFLANKIGPDAIKECVVNPLNDIKVAPYYGCQLVTPYSSGDNNDNPQNLERIITALGGKPVDFTHRTVCCGGSLAFTKKEQSEVMGTSILKSIVQAGADVITTPCGLCQINLDGAKGVSGKYIGRKVSLPVLNITQLIGVAFGLNKSETMTDAGKVKKSYAEEVTLNV